MGGINRAESQAFRERPGSWAEAFAPGSIQPDRLGCPGGGGMVSGYNRIMFECDWLRSPSQDRRNYGDLRTLAAALAQVRWDSSAAATAPSGGGSNSGSASR
jgi:hypothetical protein